MEFCGTAWYGTTQHSMEWCGMAQHGTAWHSMAHHQGYPCSHRNATQRHQHLRATSVSPRPSTQQQSRTLINLSLIPHPTSCSVPILLRSPGRSRCRSSGVQHPPAQCRPPQNPWDPRPGTPRSSAGQGVPTWAQGRARSHQRWPAQLVILTFGISRFHWAP